MNSRIEEFRSFVSKHPLLKDEVRKNERTWQNIYEEWYLYGEDDPSWNKYQEENKKENKKQSELGSTINMDSIKNIVSYVQKLNPDSVNKTLSTVQKVIQIAQTFKGPSASIPNVAQTSLYSDWWD